MAMGQPTETTIFNAIEYAMRREPVTEVGGDEGGEYEVEIYDANSLLPFVMCVLRELGFIE
ncbi:MAG TPA: hypothetical protein VG519_13235 [Pseudochrobactrum sp.]|nr:hypothetical protein [Pseudochrobactrum sp.]